MITEKNNLTYFIHEYDKDTNYIDINMLNFNMKLCRLSCLTLIPSKT